MHTSKNITGMTPFAVYVKDVANNLQECWISQILDLVEYSIICSRDPDVSNTVFYNVLDYCYRHFNWQTWKHSKSRRPEDIYRIFPKMSRLITQLSNSAVTACSTCTFQLSCADNNSYFFRLPRLANLVCFEYNQKLRLIWRRIPEVGFIRLYTQMEGAHQIHVSLWYCSSWPVRFFSSSSLDQIITRLLGHTNTQISIVSSG